MMIYIIMIMTTVLIIMLITRNRGSLSLSNILIYLAIVSHYHSLCALRLHQFQFVVTFYFYGTTAVLVFPGSRVEAMVRDIL